MKRTAALLLFVVLFTTGCWEDDGSWTDDIVTNNTNNTNNVTTCIGEAPDADIQEGVCLGARKVCVTTDGTNYSWVEPDYTLIQGYEAVEVTCDERDNNCDGDVDEGVTTTYYPDADGDSYGDSTSEGVQACTAPLNYVRNNSDCNDDNEFEFPGAIFYRDADGDGYGDPNNTTAGCALPDGHVTIAGDCNDDPNNDGALMNPDENEVCDHLDNDCNGQVDDGLPVFNYYPDLDLDGYGDAAATPVVDCMAPEGLVDNNGDCNDDPNQGGAYVYPTAPELCDGIDNDCDLLIDNNVSFIDWYPDADGDGYGDMNAAPVNACSQPAGHVLDHTDCNDIAGVGASINPVATEVCDGVDNNCDLIIDTAVACAADGYCDDNGGNVTAHCVCNTGFAGDGVTCTDIDECANMTDNCSDNATCTNTPGGFTCACNPGYSGDGVNCSDVDECLTNPCDANATCSNSAGGYSCACNSGYTGDGFTCTDVDECTLGTDNCDTNATCTNTVGSFTCACNAGYTGNGVTCTDENECALGTDTCDANATCTNTVGGYTCACNTGYTGDGYSCADVDECTDGTDNCDANATCTNTVGGFTCACNSGFTGSGTVCTDINECLLNTDNCTTNATCTNTPGSFTCACNTGYEGDGVTSCTDIDECGLGTDNCDSNATCTNTVGGFSCSCNSGYTGTGVVCTDIDECALNTDNCNINATCTNTAGGFTCACNPGFSGSGVNCVDINECTLGTDNCNVNATCTNTYGGFTCACNTGYTGDGVNCYDVDECLAGTDNCSANATCANTLGGFTCTCISGYAGDGVTCTDLDECALGTDTCDANATCTNTAGSFTCACNSGYTGTGYVCADVDECALGTDTCDTNATCTNTAGSYSCACNSGYSGDGFSCTDIDECLSNPCDTNATCANTVGSFTCTCNSGYSGDGLSCTDLDECALGTDTCDANATCTNTTGAYTCACNSGYSGDGFSCTDIDECLSNPCDSNASCANTVGSFTCTCNSGYSGDGLTCSDVDECALGTDTCDTNATCTNTVGAYTCACNSGFSGDGYSCTDIDECLSNPCTTNATCANSPGSYTCTCDTGYEGDGVTSCTDVDECALGTDNCNTNATCANTVGSFTCTCNSGYSGDGVTCTDDDECLSNPCDANATCTNYPGTFDCDCDTGYSGDGFTCSDIDECAAGTDDCDADATCTNTAGGWSCACNPGFTGTGQACADIDECADGTDDCDVNATCTNTAGSWSCACLSGYSGDGVTCVDIPCFNETGGAGCATNATCGGLLVTDNCECDAGYTGDPINEPGCTGCDSAAGYVSDGASNCVLAPSPGVGDLVVNEVMIEPNAVSDANGQWFELYNTTDATMNLADLEITVDGTTYIMGSAAWYIEPHDYIVVARDGNSGTNGGVTADITFGDMPLLDPAGNMITLTMPGSPDVTVDIVMWDASFNLKHDQSLSFSPAALTLDMEALNDDAIHWCHTKYSTFGLGDFGTPGAQNDDCVVDWCNLQWPYTTSVNQFATTEIIYGRVYEESSTIGAGQGTFVTGQVGYGTINTPASSSWTWFDATYGSDQDGLTPGGLENDEYEATMDPTILGTFDYAYRFSLDGGLSWTYCDQGGSGDGYQVAEAGEMTVLPEAPKLFISEYVEGSSNNKAIEVYNNTGGDYDMSNCQFQIYYNGGTSSGKTINFTGTIASGDVHVVCDGGSDLTLQPYCDELISNGWFSGDDAIVLQCEGQMIDSIGKIGEQVVWGSGLITTQNHTLVRECSVQLGDTNPNDTYSPDTSGEWIGYAQDTFTDLGSHTTCF